MPRKQDWKGAVNPRPKPITGSWGGLGPLGGTISFHSPAKGEDAIRYINSWTQSFDLVFWTSCAQINDSHPSQDNTWI